jgi:hypothetical protein
VSVNKYDDFYRNLLLVLRRLYYVLHSDFSVARGLFVSQVINKLNKIELGGYSFSKYRFFCQTVIGSGEDACSVIECGFNEECFEGKCRCKNGFLNDSSACVG